MASFFRRAASRASELLSRVTGGAGSSEDDDEVREGFSVKREVAVEAPRAPLIQLAVSMFGGLAQGAVQSLEWFAELLRVDEEGDVADEFLLETPPTEPPPALRSLSVEAKPRLATWVRVVGGWPLCADEAAVG